MTIKEAIKQLIEIKEYYTPERDFSQYGEDYEPITKEDKEAIDIMINVGEKQIPKKVKKEFRTIGGAITCFETDICPNCEMDFYIDDLGQTMYCDFCPDCGQALDWGGEDE